jgi:hypothetical protein
VQSRIKAIEKMDEEAPPDVEIEQVRRVWEPGCAGSRDERLSETL